MTAPRRTNPALDCPRCGRNFTSGRGLFQHLRRTHGLSSAEAQALRPKTVWRCAFCRQEFRGNGPLTRHVQTAHQLTTLPLGH
ncbi:MAG: hypothetical protein HY689_06190 [Chloroflexi bacterium]|nr:hypothetical protein [Chloroflexota bacterium]